jgi:hypothetical protein
MRAQVGHGETGAGAAVRYSRETLETAEMMEKVMLSGVYIGRERDVLPVMNQVVGSVSMVMRPSPFVSVTARPA